MLSTLILSLLLQDPAKVFLAPPEGSKEEDVKKAAAAMVARCRSFGYRNVKGMAVKGKAPLPEFVVELRDPDGFNPEMQEKIRTMLLDRPKLEVLGFGAVYAMSEDDLKKFPPGEDLNDIANWKAPPGAQYVLVIAPTNGKPMAQLIHRDCWLNPDDFVLEACKTAERKDSYRWRLTAAGLAKWDGWPLRARQSPFFISGNGFSSTYTRSFDEVKQGAVRMVTADLGLGPAEVVCAQNPIPFPLVLKVPPAGK